MTEPTAPFTGRYRGYLLILTSESSVRDTKIFDTAQVPKGTSLREAAQAWCDSQNRTLKIDWSTLTNDL